MINLVLHPHLLVLQGHVEWFKEAWTQHPLMSWPVLVLLIHLTVWISPSILKAMSELVSSIPCEAHCRPSWPPPFPGLNLLFPLWCPIPLSKHLLCCLETTYCLSSSICRRLGLWELRIFFLSSSLPAPSWVTSTWWALKHLLNDYYEINNSITFLPLNILFLKV